MGCGVSRPESTGDLMMKMMIPQKLGPLLRRKLEEIRGLKTLSNKHLINNGVEDEHSNNENEGGNAFYETQGSAKVALPLVEDDEHSIHNSNDENHRRSASPKSEGSANVALPLAEDDEHSRPDSENENGQRRASSESEGSGDAAPELVQMAVVEKMAMEETDAERGDEDEDEESARLSCMDGALLFPGSPSFRVYCMDTLENEEDEGKEEDTVTEGSVRDGNVEPLNSSEGPMSEKKQKKRRKFRRVLSKGKPVKNLLKVKSCYYPACGRRHSDSLLIATKATTP